jgi:hypothetical protein
VSQTSAAQANGKATTPTAPRQPRTPTAPRQPRTPRVTPASGAASAAAKPPGQYDPGSPRATGGGGGRVHPAGDSGAALTPAGHRAYCARNIQDAITGAAGVSNQSSTMRRGTKKSDRLTWAQKQMAIRRNKRADRKVIAAYQALAKAWLRKAKTREAVDAEINSSRKTRQPSGTYTTEG